MSKFIINVQDRINWDKIPQPTSIQKLAIKEAVKKAGNCGRLALLLNKHAAMISKWINKKIKKNQDLMHPSSATQIEKVIKIKGIRERLCPSLKR